MISLTAIRSRANEWAATHPEIRLDIDEDETPLYDDAVQFSINDLDDEYAWVGFYYGTDHTVRVTDQSDDMDEADANRLNELSESLIDYLEG